jgi:hypothetical protein
VISRALCKVGANQNVLDGCRAIRKLALVMNAVVYFARASECLKSVPTHRFALCDQGCKHTLGFEQDLQI